MKTIVKGIVMNRRNFVKKLFIGIVGVVGFKFHDPKLKFGQYKSHSLIYCYTIPEGGPLTGFPQKSIILDINYEHGIESFLAHTGSFNDLNYISLDQINQNRTKDEIKIDNIKFCLLSQNWMKLHGL